MKKVYSTSVHVSGGREGKVKSSDGILELSLAMPKELGGKGGATNPEQLFAAGYSACFESALRHVARMKKVVIKEASVDGTVELHAKDDGGFALAVKLSVALPGMDRTQAQGLVDDAHRVCPYSNATRGNIPVEILLA
jgi:Ohr subfamily peroxiredoxin